MARIPEQVIEQIRNTADIVEIISSYIELKKRGRNFFGLCPFHGEKTPSFSINPERQIYKCFGCGVGGGVINFIMEIEGMEFVDAVKFLGDQYSIDIQIQEPKGRSKDFISELFNTHEITSKIFFNNFGTEEGLKALEHLESRGLKKEIIKKFKLGYSLNNKNNLLLKLRELNISTETMKQSGLFIDTESGYIDRFRGRIIFTISNSSGKACAFAGRIFNKDDMAKYINSPETPIYNKSNTLYGLHETKNIIRQMKSVIVVEGYLDFLQLYQSGIHNIVALSGTAFTENHGIQLKRFCNKIFLAYDGDKAGRSSAIRAGYILLRIGLNPSIINIPDGLDPDDWIRTKGKDPFLNALDNSEKIISFHYNNFDKDDFSYSMKAKFVNDVINELVQISNPVDRELHCRDLSSIVGITPESIFQSMENLLDKQRRRKSIIKNQEPSVSQILVKKQLLEYDLIRLCFAKDYSIRKYLFDNFISDSLVSEFAKTVYDKIFIHLNSKNAPEVKLIISELSSSDHRSELAELSFDLEKSEPTLKSAKECVIRLKEIEINSKITLAREELKNIENSGLDPIPIMEKIKELEVQKQNITA